MVINPRTTDPRSIKEGRPVASMGTGARLTLWLLSIISGLFLSGCWDAIDLEKRGIVLLMAVDLEEAQHDILDDPGHRNLAVTFALAEPRRIAGTAEPAGGGEQGPAHWNTTVTGPSVHEAMQKLYRYWYRDPMLDHIRVLLIGEEAARHRLPDIVAAMYRHPNVRRSLPVVISEGRAADHLEIQHRLQTNLAEYLSELVTNSGASDRLARPTLLHEFVANIFTERSFITTKFRPGELEAAAEGAAVIHQGRLHHWLDEHRTAAARWTKGDGPRGALVLPCQEGDPRVFVVHLQDVSSDLRPSSASHPEIPVRVMARGTVRDAQCANLDPSRPDDLNRMQQIVGAHMESEIRSVLALHQSQQIDIFDFDRWTQRRAPRLWQELGDAWPQTFASLDLALDVRVDLRGFGAIRGR